MKILHTSDLRIGMAFPHVHRRAEDLRAARLTAFRGVLSLAAREKVAGVLLAGNTIADNRISHAELEELAEVMGQSKVPLYLLPGHLDPLTPDSPYRLKPDLFGPPVHVLREAKPLPMAEATLYPCPVRSRTPGDLARWIPPRQAEEALRIAVFCGDPPAAGADLDYLAGSTDGPESTWFGQGKGQVQVVTLPGPTVKRVTVGRMNWLDWDPSLKDPAALLAKLEGLKERESTLLRLTLSGRLTETARLELQQALADLPTQLFHFELDDQAAVVSSPDEAFTHPLLRALVHRLKDHPGAHLRLLDIVRKSGQEDLA